MRPLWQRGPRALTQRTRAPRPGRSPAIISSAVASPSFVTVRRYVTISPLVTVKRSARLVTTSSGVGPPGTGSGLGPGLGPGPGVGPGPGLGSGGSGGVGGARLGLVERHGRCGWLVVSVTTTRPSTAGTRRPSQTTWMSDQSLSASEAGSSSWITYVPSGRAFVFEPRARTATPGSLVVALFRYWVSGSPTGEITNPVVVTPPRVTLSIAILPEGMKRFSKVQVAPPPSVIGTSVDSDAATRCPPQMTWSRSHRPARLSSGRCSSIR